MNNARNQAIVALIVASTVGSAQAAMFQPAVQRPAAPVATPAPRPVQSPPLMPAPRPPVQVKDLVPVFKPRSAPTPIPAMPAPVPMPAPRAIVSAEPHPSGLSVVPTVTVPVKKAEIQFKGPELTPQVLPPQLGGSISVTVPLPEGK